MSTRREFLQAGTAAAAGSVLLSGLSAGAYAAGSDVIKVGLIGCGGRGTGAANDAFSAGGNLKLVAMGDAFEDELTRSLSNIKGVLADAAKDKIDVPEDRQFVGFDAYQKVIDSGVDMVILATPPGFRPMHFEAAVNAGKHVFMEKPVAVDAPGVRQVLAAAKVADQKGLKVGVGLQRRHQECYLDLVQRVHDGAIGDLLALRVYWNGGGVWDPRRTREECSGEMEYQMRNWYYYNWLCGDHIVEQHIHNLDVGCWLKGDKWPVKANGIGGRQVRTDKRYGEIYDHHACEFYFDDGSVMFSQCKHMGNTWSSVTEHGHGTKGQIHLDSNPRGCSIVIDGQPQRFRGNSDNPYVVEHRDLQAAIVEGKPFNEAERGAMATMVAIMGRMCTYSGKELTWEQALNSEVALRPTSYTWDGVPPSVPNDKGEYPIAIPGVSDKIV
ncbi:MAG: Gfo/Idh/MocA family oxidoreductase [Planctomyces sp.]|nr:Gfo/Idh/MocA family oxidoreductase [Planctomyces sp.]